MRCAWEVCAASGVAADSSSATTTALAKLRIDFLEIRAIDEYLARLATGARGHEPLRFHHVDEASGAAESDPQLALQVRNRHLSAADDDARGFVVQIVLLELETAGPRGLLFVFGDRVVEHR